MTPEARLSAGQRALVRFLEREGIPLAQPSTLEPDRRIDDGALFASLERVISQARLAELLASRLRLPLVDLAVRELDADTLALIAPQLARRYEVIPLGAPPGMLELAMANPLDLETLKAVEFTTSRRVRPSVATHEGVWRALVRHYGAPEPEMPPAPEPAGKTSPAPGTPSGTADPSPAVACHRRSPRILVVDADLERRTGARAALEGAGLGYLVVTARDASEAVAIATLDPPEVVVDCGGGLAGARELCRRLQARAGTDRVRVIRLVHPGAWPPTADTDEGDGAPAEVCRTAELAARVRSLVATAEEP